MSDGRRRTALAAAAKRLWDDVRAIDRSADMDPPMPVEDLYCPPPPVFVFPKHLNRSGKLDK